MIHNSFSYLCYYIKYIILDNFEKVKYLLAVVILFKILKLPANDGAKEESDRGRTIFRSFG